MKLARRSVAAAVVMVAVAALGLGLVMLAPANAASVSITNATLRWSLSNEANSGAYFGGCNFLAAGTAGNTGSPRAWTQSDGFYRSASGNVRIEKLTATGGAVAPTWSTKCLGIDGQPVSAGSTTSNTASSVVLSAGRGTVDVAANTASINWTGSFTVAFYGGLTYWTATNPQLRIAANGTGTLTATASGWGSDMEDMSRWNPLAPRTITLATLRGVKVTAGGFRVTPDYLGVAVTTPTGETPQISKGANNAAFWGSFPQSFVNFQHETGQSSYWYSSGGARDAAKPATPITVGYGTAPVQPFVATSTSLAVSPTPRSVAKAPVRLTATVVPAVAGSLAFRDGTRVLARVAVKGGKATYTTTGLAVGTHSLSAVFTPSAPKSFKGSSTRATLHVVAKAAARTALALTPAKVRAGVRGRAVARITLVGTPAKSSGLVAFRRGNKLLGTVRASAGAASLRLPVLPVGSYRIVAEYMGDRNSLRSVPVTKRLTVVRP